MGNLYTPRRISNQKAWRLMLMRGSLVLIAPSPPPPHLPTNIGQLGSRLARALGYHIGGSS